MKLNKAWWEHLAPKSMIGRRREVEQLLEDFIRASDFGLEWVRVAANPHGVFRLTPGQVIPVVRMIFMGDRQGFIAPFQKLMDGHRTVDRKSGYGLGALGEGELAIQPKISVEVVTDPAYLAMRGARPIDESTIRSPSLVRSILTIAQALPRTRIRPLPAHLRRWCFVPRRRVLLCGCVHP